MEHRPTRKKPATTTNRKTTRGRCTQTTPIQVEGPPSSRLQSKTNKNKPADQQDHQDPPEHNPAPVDPPNAIQVFNQVQTASIAGNRMQVVLPLTLIAILLINVFQIMNDAKSAHIGTQLKIHIHPQVTKKPTICPNNAKIANHFLICTMVNGTLKTYNQLHKIHPIHQPLPRTTQNSCNLR